MKLHRLKLENFRGVVAREIVLPDAGVVVVAGRNEAGKTSMIDALDALLTLADGSKHRLIVGARPTGRDVPVSVEAEFSIGTSRVVYTKQWLRRSATTLRHVAGPDAGRVLTGREAHEAAEQLWAGADTTLWRALRFLQTDGLDQGPLTGSAALRRALESRAGEGRDDDGDAATLLQRVGEECDRYWTPQRRKNVRHLQLETACREAETAAADAADRLREITAVEDELAELVEEIAAATRTLAATRAELAGLDRSAGEVDAVRARLREAERRRETARAEVERRGERAGRRRDLVAKLAAAEERHGTLTARLATAEEELAPLRAEAAEAARRHEAAQQAVQRARADHRSAQEDRAHLEDVDRHRRLVSALESVETLRAELAQLRSRPASGLTEERLEELEAAERAAERAEAELAAGSARVRFTALGQARPLLAAGAAHEVDPDEPWSVPVTDEVEVELPGQWQVRVSPEQGIDARRTTSRRAAEAFAALLAEHGVTTVAGARARWREAQRTAHRIADAQGQRDRLLDGEDEAALRDERDRLAATVEHYAAARQDPAPLPPSAVAARERVEGATASLHEAEDTATRAEATDRAAGEGLRVRETAVLNLRGAAQEQEHALAVARSALEDARREVPDEDLERAATESASALEAVQRELDGHEADLAALGAERVLADRELVAGQLTGLEAMLGERRERRSALLGRLDGMGRDRVQAEHDRAETDLAAARRALAATERRAEAALVLERALQRHRELAHARYVQPFRATVEDLGRAVYGPDFGVEVSESLEVVQRHLDGEWLPFDALSTGAREQMVVLIRLAAALLVDPQDGVPVLLDDALGHSDPQRLRRLGQAIAAAGERTQVVVLTSNPERFAGLREARRIDV